MTSKRTISATNEAAFLSQYLRIVMFVRLDLSSGVQRFHTEIGPKIAVHPIFGSETYLGLGDFGGINGEVRESTQGSPIGISLMLTGVSASLVNKSFVDDYFRRDADVMIGLQNEAGNLIDDPEILFSGYMDTVNISFTKNNATIQMQLESRGTNLLTSSDVRFTDEDLQREYPGDRGGEYIYRMSDLTLRWGAQGVWSGAIGPSNPGRRGPRRDKRG